MLHWNSWYICLSSNSDEIGSAGRIFVSPRRDGPPVGVCQPNFQRTAAWDVYVGMIHSIIEEAKCATEPGLAVAPCWEIPAFACQHPVIIET